MKQISYEQLKSIRDNLMAAFNIYSEKDMKLTGYKESENYEFLIEAIKETTDVVLSKSTLQNLITLKHNGQFQHKTFEAIDKFIATYVHFPITLAKKGDPEPIKQKVFWSVNQSLMPGVFINSFKGQFIPWNIVKQELESRVITQYPRIIPVGCTVEMRDFYGKKNWVIGILDKSGSQVGSVWLGGNPYKNWYLDGYVRVGKSISDTECIVYQILQRYSDGSYRIVKSYI